MSKLTATNTASTEQKPRRSINAAEALRDIRKGMSDGYLMERYGLSARGLQSLFRKLVASNLVSQSELDKRSSLSDRNVKADLYWCPVCKMPQFEPFDVCPQCGIIVSRKVQKRSMQTNRPRLKGGSRPGTQEVDANPIKRDVLFGGSAPDEEEFQMHSACRRTTRYETGVPFPIYEATNPEARGVLRDLTEEGVGIRGIEAKTNEIKTLVIPANEFLAAEPITFRATCRWALREGPGRGNIASGFEVIKVLKGSLQDLEIALRAIPLEQRRAMKKRLGQDQAALI